MENRIKRSFIFTGTAVLLGTVCLAYNSLIFLPENAQSPAEVLSTQDSQISRLLPAEKELSPRDMALLDSEGRLSEDFQIPEALRDRVGFWFDVYTKYDSKKYVIHHRELPWVVFDVVDTTDLFLQKRNASWMNRQDADHMAEAKKEAIFAKLKVLSVRAHYDNLPADEQKVFDALKDVPGSRKNVFKNAMKSLRIQLGQKDMFEKGLVRSAPYLATMEELFVAHGLPKELVRIPLVESSFHLEAESRVGALGVWQIMPGVGKKSMLINEQIDERQSPLKSTVFAAKMLKHNKRSLKNWPLTVTSYNHGIGSLLKAARELKTFDLQEIIDRNKSKSFQFASSNFYACFMAAVHAEFYSKELFPELSRPEPFKMKKMILSKGTALKDLPALTGTALDELKLLNTDLHGKLGMKYKLPAGFQLFVPVKDSIASEKAAEESLKSASNDSFGKSSLKQ